MHVSKVVAEVEGYVRVCWHVLAPQNWPMWPAGCAIVPGLLPFDTFALASSGSNSRLQEKALSAARFRCRDNVCYLLPE